MAEPKNYKDAKKTPAPEVAKPTSHTKKKKHYVIEYRLDKEARSRQLAVLQKELEKLAKNEWEVRKKYVTEKDAIKAIRQLNNQTRNNRQHWLYRYEYRIVEKEDE